MEERKIEAVTESPTSLDGLAAIEQRTPMAMERKIENINISVEQLLRQKIVELESKLVEKDQKIVALEMNSTNYNYGSIFDIPDEILVKILGYLSNHDILRNVAQVSKQFRKLTQDQFLIRKIDVHISSWFKGTKCRPQELTKQEREKYCNDFLEVCKRSRKLTFFSLNLSGLVPVGQTPIQPKIEKALALMDHQFLEEFCLKSCNFQVDGKMSLKYLYQCPNLKIFKFESKYRLAISSKFINDFEHKNLEELHLFGHRMNLKKSAFKKFLETIVGNFPKLQNLYLSLWFIGAHRFASFDECREICQTIATEKKIKIEISKY